jgi:hypothetical protein
MSGMRLFAGPLHLALPEYPAITWNFMWYGPDHFGTEGARIEADLKQLPGKQFVIVGHSPQHSPLDEWVNNAPDIDHSKIIWAREMDAASNKELFDYYKDRTVWLVQPDIGPVDLSAYAAQQ